MVVSLLGLARWFHRAVSRILIQHPIPPPGKPLLPRLGAIDRAPFIAPGDATNKG